MASTILVLSHCGNELRTVTDTLLIGRGSTCNFRLPLPNVSREHAKLTPLTNGRWAVTDMGSTNGTIVNGEKLVPGTTVHLDDGDSLQVGPVCMHAEIKKAA